MKIAVTPVRILKACSVPAFQLLMVNKIRLITVAGLERAMHTWCGWQGAWYAYRRHPILVKTGGLPSARFLWEHSSVWCHFYFLVIDPVFSLSFSLSHSLRSEYNVGRDGSLQKLLLLQLALVKLSLFISFSGTGIELPRSFREFMEVLFSPEISKVLRIIAAACQHAYDWQHN